MVSEFLPKSTLSEIQTTKQVAAEQQFLRFHLVPDTTAMLPVLQMTEVLTISVDGIVPIPQMPAWVMGVYNWRGEILWMVDLGHLVGLTPLYQHVSSRPDYQAIVIRSAQQGSGKQQVGSEAPSGSLGSQASGRKVLGLVVNRVEDMEWCHPDAIQSPTMASVSFDLVPFLRGYWLKPNREMLVVLDGHAVIDRMPRLGS